MATTLPGMPTDDDGAPEPDTLPVEPDDGTTNPGLPPETREHEPVEPPRA